MLLSESGYPGFKDLQDGFFVNIYILGVYELTINVKYVYFSIFSLGV
jgi:hypothetical protein